MNIKIEYKKGILFIRLEGLFNRITYKYFDEEVYPVILKNGLKYIVINFDKLKSIDRCGIDSLNGLLEIINEYSGKVTFCNLRNLNIKEFINNNLLNNNYFESNNELTAIGMFEL